ncbi:MAG: cation:proton antiporter [Terriglobia bacterium]
MSLPAIFGLLGGLLVLAFVANQVFRHTRVPDVVVLLAAGLLLGPGLGWVEAAQFEAITQLFGTLAIILILFEGGLELNLRETLAHSPGALVLAVVAYLLSLGLVTLVLWQGLGLSVTTALLGGAVLGCTSSSIVLPVLQQLEVRQPVKITLVLEATLGDVLAVLTVGLLLELAATGEPDPSRFFLGLLFKIAVSLAFAMVAGVLWSRLLPVLSEQRFWHVLTFSVVLLLYAVTEAVGASGFIAALGFGLVLSNVPGIERRLVDTTFGLEAPAEEPHLQILTFHSELAFLVRTFFFVLIGVVVKFAALRGRLLLTLGILGAIFLARWLAVKLSRWAWREIYSLGREVILYMLPRGLITVVLAFQVLEARGSEVAFLPAVAFATILVTNLIVVFGSVRARRHALVSVPAEPAPPPSE